MKALRRGLDLVVRPERAEALLWSRLRFDKRDDAREPLFDRYAPFARKLAVRVRAHSQPENRSDAEQWAYSGLLQAIDAFDPLRGAPFPAFAKPRIIGSVRDGLSRLGEMAAQSSAERRRRQERLRSLKSRAAEADGDPVERLGTIAAGLAIGLMLEGSGMIGGEDCADPGPSPYDSLAWRETQARLEVEIGRLPAPEATVLRQHYLHGLAFAQVADLMGLSRGRISQLHHSALAKLRLRLKGGLHR